MFAFFRNLKTAIADAPPFQFSPESVAVSRSELKVVSFWSAVIATILLLPYLYAYLFTPPDLHFMGCFGFVADQEMHLAWSYQVAHGAFLGKNLFTSIPHDGGMFNLYLFALGILSKISGLHLDACYQICRFFTSWALGISVYYFVALFLSGKNRFWGWMAVIVVGGFGWILPWLNQGFDWQIPRFKLPWKSIDGGNIHEAFAFASMLYVPLYSASLIFLCFTLRWSYIAIASNCYRMALIAGTSLFLVSFVHPYDIIIIITILCATALLLTTCYPNQWTQWIINLVMICLFGIPSILYNYWLLHTNPGFTMWEGQCIGVSPGITNFFLGLGISCCLTILWFLKIYHIKDIRRATPFIFILLIIFFMGFVKYLNLISLKNYQIAFCILALPIFIFFQLQSFKKNRAEFLQFLLITTWILLFPVLVYIPLNFQRRMSVGLSIPFAILSIEYLRTFFSQHNLSEKKRFLVYFLFIAMSSINSFYHYSFVWKVATLNCHQKDSIWEFLPFVEKREIQAFLILEKAPNIGSILGAPNTCPHIPRYTGKQVVCGSQQTENLPQTDVDVRHFYSGAMSSTQRLDFLKAKRVAYIFYGLEEQMYDASGTLPEWLERNHWRSISPPCEKKYQVFMKEDAAKNNE